MLNNTITLNIEFHALAEFASQSVTVAAVDTIGQFEIADVYLRQFDLTAPSQGLKNEVRFNIDNFVTYPYQAFSEYQTTIDVTNTVQGNAPGGDPALQGLEVNIQNIISADLTEFVIMFVRDTDNAFHQNAVGNNGAGNNIFRQCHLIGAPVRDLELRLNGQTMILYPGSTYFGFNQPLMDGDERLMITAPTNGAPANVAAMRTNQAFLSTIYKMVLSQENPLMMEGKEMMNVPRFPNMTLQLRFNPENNLFNDPAAWVPPTPPTGEIYHIYVLQLYNAVWKLGEDMGSSELLTR